MAFNAKNLTYDKSEPAFLQRLKAGYAAQDGRNNVQHARPTKSRLKMDDEDDGPVILDETGQVVEADVYEGMLKGKTDADCAKNSDTVETDASPAAGMTDQNAKDKDAAEREQQQKVVEVGVAKKRKAIKVVGEDETDKAKPQPAHEPPGNEEGDNPRTAKPKKKAKKIKLSFDEPE